MEVKPDIDALVATYGDRISIYITGFAHLTSYNPNTPKPAYKSPLTRILNQRFARLATQWGADVCAITKA